MTALFNLFYLYDPWLFHVVRMSFVAGLAALVVLAYQYIKKQKPQGIILPLDSLAVLGGLIVFSVIPLLLNDTKDLFSPQSSAYHRFYSPVKFALR
jgi:hypothetical protein